MKLRLAEISKVLGIQGPVSEAVVSGYSIDSRTIQPGDLFFAIRGETNDGHDFVPAAIEKGAAAVVVGSVLSGRFKGLGAEILPVADTLAALQSAAKWAREQWSGELVGVTGSAGKTTTKDVIAGLLSAELRVGKTEGNFNNHIGLPLSLLRLPEESQVAVIELGMNHAGEIRALAAIARPTIGVVTNVGYAHIENFASIEDIALAKRELIETLPAQGLAVLNADDPRVASFREVHPGPVVTFGLSPEADVRADQVKSGESGSRFRVNGAVWVETFLPGRHGISNILAGLAVAFHFGIPPSRLVEAVRELRPAKMRGQRITLDGVTILDDCYNANPDAMRAMIDVLRDMAATRRIAVLGEMRELGAWSECLHREVGDYAARNGVDVLIGVHGAARSLSEEARAAGLKSVYFFDEASEAGEFLRDFARAGDAILFKGSRGTRLENALEAFLSGARARG